ncbi:alpha/beta hydrolase [Staphylococcus simiae]|uniref:Putative esterase n=1 Tax=Staphylococcus simiae CCM 7213 = CCUG 51256 TaxID=911238 RepID=G5JK97_9STAP|nr:alpha/beta hydrolase-fold protein [Staphylococcus simiae]EHJ07427.1 putative esterase [Staphylococcus simiae CCM 7213 = CCUG 51256]PNZ13225.1 alpha/beta hydrolase [Staphylococcus simiae]SNV54833.1 esterase [Staphylococcus simiae]
MRQFVEKFKVNHYDITIKLPKDYFKKLDKLYPALIVHDGDDLFKKIEKNIIFIGVASQQRAHDFTPWEATIGHQQIKGQADQYLNWLTQQLIPTLRQKYRISLDNQDLGISGASYGALVSMYALYTKPNCFGKYIFISPSLWYPHFLNYMKEQSMIPQEVRIYWYVGLKEGIKHTLKVKDMVPNSLEGKDILNQSLEHPMSKFEFECSKRGIHRQRYFKKYFKKGLKAVYQSK